MIQAHVKSSRPNHKTSGQKVDNCYFPPPHLIADEAKNFVHQKRVGDYFLGAVLGEGSFAKTRLGAHVFSGEKVAVKTINKEKAKKDQYVYKNLRREGQILRKVNHPYIIRLLDILETENNYYLITTYCSGGEFIDRIEARKQLSENEVRRHIRQLLDATIALHNLGIVHRDLKVENLLLDARGNLQVIDFGLSNILPPRHYANKDNFNKQILGNSQLTTSSTNPNSNSIENNKKNIKTKTTSASVESASSAGSPSSSSPYSSNGSHGNKNSGSHKNKNGSYLKPPNDHNYGLKTQCGSPAYAAPELLAKKPYNEKVDCWSIGIITYALLTGRLPFTVEPFRIQALYRKMVNGDMNSIPSHISSKCKNFIYKLLTPDPDLRPTAYEMSKHEWLQENLNNLSYSHSCNSMKNAIKNHFLSNSCLSTESSPHSNLTEKSNSNSVLNCHSVEGSNPIPKSMTVNKLDSAVIKYMSEKLEFMGTLSEIIENVVNSKPSRALAAYFLFKQKFDREKALFPIEKKLTADRRKSLVVSLDNNGHLKKYDNKQPVNTRISANNELDNNKTPTKGFNTSPTKESRERDLTRRQTCSIEPQHSGKSRKSNTNSTSSRENRKSSSRDEREDNTHNIMATIEATTYALPSSVQASKHNNNTTSIKKRENLTPTRERPNSTIIDKQFHKMLKIKNSQSSGNHLNEKEKLDSKKTSLNYPTHHHHNNTYNENSLNKDFKSHGHGLNVINSHHNHYNSTNHRKPETHGTVSNLNSHTPLDNRISGLSNNSTFENIKRINSYYGSPTSVNTSQASNLNNISRSGSTAHQHDRHSQERNGREGSINGSINGINFHTTVRNSIRSEIDDAFEQSSIGTNNNKNSTKLSVKDSPSKSRASSQTSSNSRSSKHFSSQFGKRVLAAKRFFEKAPKWIGSSSSNSNHQSGFNSKNSSVSDYNRGSFNLDK